MSTTFKISPLPQVTAATARPLVPRVAVVGIVAGAAAMAFVGGSVAVSAALGDASLFTAQALRYAVACVLLLVAARMTRRRLVLPRGSEWGWLLGVALTGLVLFNVALVEGSKHAEPAVLGVAVACVPLLLAVAAPVLQGRRPRPTVLVVALVVTSGAALVQGVGRSDVRGLVWFLVVLGCEVGFTLLAVPVLRRHGPWGVSVHATWIAAAGFAVAAVVVEGPTAALRLSAAELVVAGYLAVAVTAVAFVLWYLSVRTLGAAVAGLLTGVAPVTAALTGVALGGPEPGPLVWVGIAVVGVGLAVGLPVSSRDEPGTVPAGT